ncbi:DUF4886 domain-containing protein [Acinetobacter baumannii]|uniref:DUF4886 domain-containing protein n=1 Tax=Acinetobacter baumannii TaxID=470 RepID=UPI002941A8B4|nr:DUF4886 domain-containing protein [Acinetobacter baumannii]MDV4323831.1 DUF4886 domain-containing protein [Acinetobacter baumannii]
MPLPNILEFIGTNVTQAKFKVALEKLLSYLSVEGATKVELSAAVTPKADKTYVDNALGQFQSGSSKFYATLADANADIANIMPKIASDTIKDLINVGEVINGGTWYKASYTATSLTKSPYDALTNSKEYTDKSINERTLQSSKTGGKEIGIITDKNGRRTWIEIGSDGGPTERTKRFIKNATIQEIKSKILVLGIVDKNGRLISGIDKFGGQVTKNPSLSSKYLSGVVDKKGRLISGIDKQGLAYPKSSPISGSGDKKIKILGIGNSFTQDAFMYIPWLLKELGVTNFSIVVLIYGGCTLEQHYNFAINNQSVYDLEVYDTDGPDNWVSKGAKTLKEGINFLKFDTIVLQQQSARSWDYGSYTPYLNPLIDYIYNNINYSTKLGWHGTPSAPDGERYGNWNWNGSGSFTSAEFYTKQQEAYQQTLADTPIEYVIPTGTAVQNLRSTFLKDLGGLNNLTSDGLHLDEGIPCLAGSYAVLLKFLEIFNLQGSVFGSRILPTAEWLSDKNIQGPNGTPARVTPENIYIAQKCAIAAIKKPFQTSSIN